jgi:outer membrane protein assembly factor BamB
MKTLGTLALVTALLCAGCSGDAEEDDPSEADPSGPRAAQPAEAPRPLSIEEIPAGEPKLRWRLAMRSFGQPVVVDGTMLVVVAARGDELDIRGLDVATGTQKWSRPFSPGNETQSPFIAAQSFATDTGAAYAVFQDPGQGVGPASSYRMPFLAVEVATGEIRARTRPLVASWPAVPCDDDLDVCLADADAEDPYAKIRWDLTSFRLHPEPDHLPRLAGEIASGGFYAGGEDFARPTYLGRHDNSHDRLWQRKVDAIVGERWAFDGAQAEYFEDAGLLLLGTQKMPTAAEERRYDQGRRVRLDESARRLIALSAADGTPMWTHDGADLGCRAFTSDELPVRCAVRGRSVHDATWTETDYRQVDVTIEGFDPSTGDSTWSQALSRRASVETMKAAGSPASSNRSLVDDQDFRVVPTADGPRMLSLVDGSSVALDHSARVLCSDPMLDFEYAADVNDFFGRDRGDIRRVCTPDEELASGSPTAAGLFQGAEDTGGGAFVLATEAHVSVYDVPAA